MLNYLKSISLKNCVYIVGRCWNKVSTDNIRKVFTKSLGNPFVDDSEIQDEQPSEEVDTDCNQEESLLSGFDEEEVKAMVKQCSKEIEGNSAEDTRDFLQTWGDDYIPVTQPVTPAGLDQEVISEGEEDDGELSRKVSVSEALRAAETLFRFYEQEGDATQVADMRLRVKTLKKSLVMGNKQTSITEFFIQK